MEARYKSIDIPENMSENRIDNNQGGLINDILDYEQKTTKKATNYSSQPNNSELKINYRKDLPMTESHKNITDKKSNYNGIKRVRAEKCSSEKNKEFVFLIKKERKSEKNEIKLFNEENIKNKGRKEKQRGHNVWFYEEKKIQKIIINKKSNFDSDPYSQENIPLFDVNKNSIDILEEENNEGNLDLNALKDSETNKIKETNSKKYINTEPEPFDYFNNIESTYHPINNLEETLNNTLEITEN